MIPGATRHVRLAPVVALAVVAVAVVAAACGSTAAEETRFEFTDERGRRCTQTRFGPTATCSTAPSPAGGCPPEKEACFVIYVPRADAGPALEHGIVWNCDSCCVPGSSLWVGSTADCAAVACTTDRDCEAENGTCTGGRCRSGR
jgi:hypothetical protein